MQKHIENIRPNEIGDASHELDSIQKENNIGNILLNLFCSLG